MARRNPQVEHLERMNMLLREQMESMRRDPGELPNIGCGDGSCIVRRPKGQHTNGGCRCEPLALRRAVTFYRNRCWYLEQVIREMRSDAAKDGGR